VADDRGGAGRREERPEVALRAASLGLEVPPAARLSGLRALRERLDTSYRTGLIGRGLARQDRSLSLARLPALTAGVLF
jgi:hypothetical protein